MPSNRSERGARRKNAKAARSPLNNIDEEKVSPGMDLSNIDLSGAPEAPPPDEVQPMLATLADEPFDLPGWLYEIKWDGFRAIAHVEHGKVRLVSRTQQDFRSEFPVIVQQLEKIPFQAVLDGEIVVVDDEGRASFRLLQHYRKTGEGLLVYYVFDLLHLTGHDLRRLPLQRRKEILEQVLPGLPRVKYSAHVEGQGSALLRLAGQNDVEGILAKEGSSLYRPGVRSKEWLKFKTHLRQEAVIGGFTEPRGSRENIGALLLGVYEGKQLQYVGHTGGGFTRAELAEVRQQLEPFIQDSSPFSDPPKTNTRATWVKPELVCEVRFAEWTTEGRMRQPVFMGLRSDIQPTQVKREQPVPAEQTLERKKFVRSGPPKEIVQVDGREVTLTHPQRVYWPKEDITKLDLASYYRQMADVLLPYLVDRPLTLYRFPEGIEGPNFWQKDFDWTPDWVQRAHLEAPSAGPEGEAIDYLLCQDEATLVYLAQLGGLELHPWSSRLGSLDRPDFLVFDIDPGEQPFLEAIRTALLIHQVLERIEAANYIKTSGKTGLHVFVPLGARYSYDQAREFTHLVYTLVNKILPKTTSLARNPKDRKGKIYLDYLQNSQGKTIVAPYSLRPKAGAPVSTPLRWEEVVPGLQPRSFHWANARQRVDEFGDLWRGVLGPGIEMAYVVNRLEQLWTSILEKPPSLPSGSS